MVDMRMELVRDPNNRTILLTANVDATSYHLTPGIEETNPFGHAEAAVGATYAIGSVSGHLYDKSLTMTPARPSLKINADIGRGDGCNMDYCRPSSNHPGGVSVLYVDQNAQFLSERISYFVLARFMSSEDQQMKYPGKNEFAAPLELRINADCGDINP